MIAILELGGRLLATPRKVADEAADELETVGVQLLALTAGGAMTWGVVVATYRGGLQLLYAPLKAPLLLLVPLAVCLPLMRVLFDPDGGRLSARQTAAAGLASMALSSLIAAAIAPVLWLWLSLDVTYHSAVLGMVASLGLAALPGFYILSDRLSGGEPRLRPMIIAMIILGLVTGQTGWLLRPFVVRPTAEIALLRPVEGDVLSGLGTTAASARGSYDGWEARPSGVVGRFVEGDDARGDR